MVEWRIFQPPARMVLWDQLAINVVFIPNRINSLNTQQTTKLATNRFKKCFLMDSEAWKMATGMARWLTVRPSGFLAITNRQFKPLSLVISLLFMRQRNKLVWIVNQRDQEKEWLTNPRNSPNRWAVVMAVDLLSLNLQPSQESNQQSMVTSAFMLHPPCQWHPLHKHEQQTWRTNP